jgi:hypothetical protein
VDPVSRPGDDEAETRPDAPPAAFAHPHRIIHRDISAFARPRGDSGAIVVTAFDRLVVFEEHVPTDPAQLHRWIDETTNAVIDDSTGAITWREGSR